ncbi:MAG: beta-galactosidase, partial [Acidobacteria bacterium]|nr:beta-galactosidase [Acidobacteriota bacterium]
MRLKPHFILVFLLTLIYGCTATVGEKTEIDYPVGLLEPVPHIRQRPEWNRFTILVWQWQNNVVQDLQIYIKAGLSGFHIDRGFGKEAFVQFSIKNSFPYYVDHAAGKGILYLSGDLKPQVVGKRSLLVRPKSLADPQIIDELKEQIRANVQTTKEGLVFAYAFDDEISLGSFNSPAEVDAHPLSVAWYRQWLEARYGRIGNLNEAWDSPYASFEEIGPVSFENVRRSASTPPLKNWNLSPWMEWRHFMDYQFAQVLANLTNYTNKIDSKIPAGFVGGQQPSAYGGYDYALLSRAVQWMEGESDLLRSFWNRPRRPRVLTYHLSGSYKTDAWTLWSCLAHGDQATIAWPEGWFLTDESTGNRYPAKEIESLTPVFREVQGEISEFIVDPDTHLETDPIGIYYSHPSIRAGWAMDSIPHGRTWPNRSSSIDDGNLASGWLRRSWCRLLEDLGYQYEFISYLDVQEKRIDLA